MYLSILTVSTNYFLYEIILVTQQPQWHIFIILIVSCTSTIVAPSNLNIIGSIGMEVHNSPYKFKRDRTQIMRYSISKIMVFPYIFYCGGHILYCGGQGCPPQYKTYGKTMILKMPYLMICICNPFEILVDLHTSNYWTCV